jgi:hypothetical protein
MGVSCRPLGIMERGREAKRHVKGQSAWLVARDLLRGNTTLAVRGPCNSNRPIFLTTGEAIANSCKWCGEHVISALSMISPKAPSDDVKVGLC